MAVDPKALAEKFVDRTRINGYSPDDLETFLREELGEEVLSGANPRTDDGQGQQDVLNALTALHQEIQSLRDDVGKLKTNAGGRPKKNAEDAPDESVQPVDANGVNITPVPNMDPATGKPTAQEGK